VTDSPAADRPAPKAAAPKRPGATGRKQPKAPREPTGAPPPTGTGRRVPGGPVGDAVHVAAKAAGAGMRVAETGVRVAGALTSEVIRRLPRP
jgi:hypothetical protein